MEEEKYTPSEPEVEQQMYQAMAAEIQKGGQNVTTKEVAQSVEGQISNHSQESREGDAETIEKMAIYQAEHREKQDAYVVRGGRIKCQYGSHCRQLNLPRCHGVYVCNQPVMFKKDCVAGTEGAELNIRTFGVCSSPDNDTGGSVCLQKETEPNPDGSFPDEKASGTVTGTPCIPEIIGEWDDCHVDTHIGIEGEEALTTKSFLVCRYGGLIEIIRSGQEDGEK